MKIFYTLIAGFMTVAMLTGLIAYIGLTNTNAISSSYMDVKEETFPVMEALEKMKFHTSERIHYYTHGALSEGAEHEYHEEINKATEEYYSNLNKYEVLVDKYFPDEKGSLEKIKKTTERFNRSCYDILELGNSGAPIKGSKEYVEINAAEKELIEAIDEALEYEYTEFDERSEQVEGTIKSTRDAILLVSLITFIMSIVIGAVISISISNPIIKLTEAAREISRGKLDTSVDIRSNDETGILSDAFNKMVRNISDEIEEHRRAEDELKRTGEQISIMIDSLPLIPYTCKAEGDFAVTYISKSVTRITGYKPGDFTSNPSFWADNIHPEDKQKVFEELTLLFEKGEYYHEYRYKISDGSYSVFGDTLRLIKNPDGKISHIVGTWQDITERKLAEISLRESEERFRSVAQSANDAIISSDGHGKIVFWNDAAKKIFGYESSEVLGKQITILMREKYREDHNKVMERIRTTGESHIIGKTVELHALRKDGSEFPMEISLSSWKTGEKIFFSAIMRDITERRRNEGIQRENERLALANRAKSNFLMVMSHELRTPLNAIIGFTELLKKKEAGDLNQKQQRYADNVHLSGKNLLRIIDDLLDLTRVESGKMEFTIEHVSVPVAVNEVLENIKEKAGKQKIIIKKDLGHEIEFIDTDGQKFRQVLNNLLDNAVKFSKPEGGTVTITAEKEGDMAKFSVADNGIGINEENMGRLFHSFEQLDSGIARKYGGTGLGLAVSKKLVELLGGRIMAQSRYGEGSTFTFYLPVAAKKEGGG
ncbi:MAG: PAS domain S-box protein [Euryarchaeota archaeon]|nr:PAS domain S-box protein [Euryarchaeota archaeon]